MADPILFSFRRQHGFEAADRGVIDRIWFDVMFWLDERRYYLDACRLSRGSVNG
jgi:hypothetical protein